MSIEYDKQIQSLKFSGKNNKYEYHIVGDGLSLRIDSVNKKAWFFKYSSPTKFGSDGKKKQRNRTFGLYPSMTLKMAKDERERNNKLIAQGIDPIEYDDELKSKEIAKAKNTINAIYDEWFSHTYKGHAPSTIKKLAIRILLRFFVK